MKPKLRPIEAHAVEHEGDDYFLLHDPQEIAPDLLIPHSYGALLQLFDGTRDATQLAADFEAAHGFALEEEFVAQIIEETDAHLLLESPRFGAHLAAQKREYSQTTSRRAAFAGRAYPDEPAELSQLLDELSRRGAALRESHNAASTREGNEAKTSPDVPTSATASTRNQGEMPRSDMILPSASTREEEKRLRGIVVPHIDFTRGGAVEAMAYDALRGETFDLLLVLGIAHKGVRYPFCATTKDYETPLGTARTDREFVEALQSRLGEKLTREEMAHQNEHSIEFVTTFLQHHENLKNARIAPILCGGFFEELRSGASPSSNPEVAQFCDVLRELVEERESLGERVGFIASVDLAHVGTQFGDARVLAREDLERIESADRAFLRCAENGDAEALHAALSRDDNARNVDAHPALYTLLHAFPNIRAQLLHYDQAFDAQQNIVVTFAAMTLFEE